MYEVKENTLRISVRNLVEFIFSTGDIDSGSGKLMDVRVMQEGARIHRKLQKAAGSRYHAEVPLKYTVDLQDVDQASAKIDWISMLQQMAQDYLQNPKTYSQYLDCENLSSSLDKWSQKL